MNSTRYLNDAPDTWQQRGLAELEDMVFEEHVAGRSGGVPALAAWWLGIDYRKDWVWRRLDGAGPRAFVLRRRRERQLRRRYDG